MRTKQQTEQLIDELQGQGATFNDMQHTLALVEKILRSTVILTTDGQNFIRAAIEHLEVAELNIGILSDTAYRECNRYEFDLHFGEGSGEQQP